MSIISDNQNSYEEENKEPVITKFDNEFGMGIPVFTKGDEIVLEQNGFDIGPESIDLIKKEEQRNDESIESESDNILSLEEFNRLDNMWY